MHAIHRLFVVACLAFATLLGSLPAQAQTVSRGPYLQRGSAAEVTVRWRTSVATDSRVLYGTTQGSLTQVVTDSASVTNHEIRISGLNADTKYFYAVGTTTAVLAGNDANHFFVTFPAAGQTKKTRVWVLGDAGTAGSSQTAVRDAYYNFTGSTHTDLWLMLGDNAYSTGTDSEYQNAVFNMYPTLLRKSVLFPTRGNHESDANGTGSTYYNIFTMPTAGESGGVASGTEAFYSYDYGNIHFVCLDSQGSNRTATGAMATWLTADLAANTKTWTVVFFHHPPYSKGSHNSDTESQLIDMRSVFNPIFEDYGVDLVLAGHSHSYERSFFIDGHYGASSTFAAASHVVQAGDGRENGSGAYTKSATTPIAHAGTVYNVAGSSGQTSGGTLNHPAMYVSLNVLGSVVLDVDGTRLDAKFIDNLGQIRDYWTMLKSGTGGPQPPSGVNALAGNAQVSVSWAAASGAASYNVKRATVSGGPYTTVASGVTTTSYVDIGLTNGTTYYYVVTTVDALGVESVNSNEAAATPSGVPNPPSNLTAVTPSGGNGRTKIDLAWTDNSNNESGFKIERATSASGPFTQIATVGANGTSYRDSGLARNTTYFYRVRSYSAGGDSAYSNTASATTR